MIDHGCHKHYENGLIHLCNMILLFIMIQKYFLYHHHKVGIMPDDIVAIQYIRLGQYGRSTFL